MTDMNEVDSGSSSKLRIKMPNKIWLASISRKFPNVVFEFKSSLPVQSDEMMCNSLLLLKGVNLNQVHIEMKSYNELTSIRVLKSAPTESFLTIQSKGHLIIFGV